MAEPSVCRSGPFSWLFLAGKENLTLRIHRGKGVAQLMESTLRAQNAVTRVPLDTRASFSNSRASFSNSRASFSKPHEEIKISISYPSTENMLVSPSPSIHSSLNFHDHRGRRKSVFMEDECSPKSSKKGIKRNFKMQVKRFRVETKAAKTLAIIVGLFIVCWLPFFTMYVLRAFCEHCINELLFSIVFWIGYCNSAVNPFIYALFSRDFRLAFKQIILACLCSSKLKENLIRSTLNTTTTHLTNSPSGFTPMTSTPRNESVDMSSIR
jgi:octopamine receptor